MSVRAVGFEVSGLSYHYPDGSRALSDLALAAAPGERLALLGPNGAGKSTLLLHLAGLLPERRRYLHTHGAGSPPHAHDRGGSIVIDGIEISERALKHVRERVGIVFQDPDDQLFGLTVDEEVGYGPRARGWPADDVRDAVSRALAEVGLAGYGERSPHHLSVGEKRRVCLAGALACRPRLLLIDEPSSGLDPRGRRELAALLDSLDATLVLASHDLGFVRRVCPRAVILDRGRVVAAGETGRLLDDETLLLRYGLA